VTPGHYRALHVLGAAVGQDAPCAMSVVTDRGETLPLPAKPLTTWDRAPAHGERVGFVTARRNAADGPEPGVHCWLHHLTIALDPERTVAKIILPRDPRLRLMAISLEAVPAPAGPLQP
jgi:hypothetical protein